MSPRSTKNVFLAGMSLAMMWSSQMVQVVESQACTVLNVYGSNGVVGGGFGVDKSGLVPRSGTGGDAGADATLFSGTNPNPVCGKVALLHGAVDIAKESAKVSNIPSIWPNGSIPVDVFQINRNGGGPGMAEISLNADGKDFTPVDVTLNLPGNFGFFAADRRTLRVVITLKEGMSCGGGPTRDQCLIRFQAGQDADKTQNTCGGCFLVQLKGKVVRTTSKVVSSPGSYTLTTRQLDELVAASVGLAKEEHLVEAKPRHKKRGHHQ